MQTVISDKIIKLLNYRIKEEELSSRIYLAISTCMSYKGYNGAAKLFKKYSDEETVHASFAYEYLLDLDIRPEISALENIDKEYKGIVDAVQTAFEHEIVITNQCKELAKACAAEGDYMTLALAQKYLMEQVEEIQKTTDLLNFIDTLTLEGKEPCPVGLRMLDDYMGELAE
jgi:ferritin